MKRAARVCITLLWCCLSLPQGQGRCETGIASSEQLLSRVTMSRYESSCNTGSWETPLGLLVPLPGSSLNIAPPGWEQLDYVRSLTPDREAYRMPAKGLLAGSLVFVFSQAIAQRHEFHSLLPSGDFTAKPSRVITTTSGSLFTGIYADMNGDGWPDLLRAESKKFGLFDAKAVSEVFVHRYVPDSDSFESKPSFSVRRKGFFVPALNGFDLDGDGKGDLIFCDVTHGALTTEQMAEALWNGNLTLRLYGYLSHDSWRGFEAVPSFEHKQKVGLSRAPDLTIYIDERLQTPMLRAVFQGREHVYPYDRRANRFMEK